MFILNSKGCNFIAKYQYFLAKIRNFLPKFCKRSDFRTWSFVNGPFLGYEIFLGPVNGPKLSSLCQTSFFFLITLK